MTTTIQEILSEANLSEDQINQIVSLVEEARVEERVKLREAHGKEIKSLVESKEDVIRNLMQESVTAKRALEALEERVAVKDKRISAYVGSNVAVGIDIDPGGTLAFTVTDGEGASVAELNKPDSDAIKSWFKSLSEAIEKAGKDAGIEPDGDEEGKEDKEDKEQIEERVRAEVYSEVEKVLSESLEPMLPMIRQARAYGKLTERFQAIAEAIAPSIIDTNSTTLMNESRLEAEVRALQEERDLLIQESVQEKMKASLAERTQDMAVTTRERVIELVESVKHTNLDEFNTFLEKAIEIVKPIAQTATKPTDLNETRNDGASENKRIASYVSAL